MSHPTPLGQLLLRRFRWCDDALRASLSGSGWPSISSAQSLVFAHLAPEGSTTTELATRIGVTRQAVQQTVAGLVRHGLLEYAPPGRDRRERAVRLTPLGMRNVAAALHVFAALEDHLARQLGPAAVDALRRALDADWGEPPALGAPAPPPS